MKKVLYLIIPVWLLFSCQPEENPQEPKEKNTQIPVKTQVIMRESHTLAGEYYGRIQGIKEVTLLAFSGGNVESISATEGDPVTLGQSLAVIDGAKARTTYELAKLNEKVARDTMNSQKKFLKSGNTSQLAADQAELAWLQAQNNLIDAEKMRESAFAESPITGTVLTRYIDPYDELSPGMPTFTLADMSRVQIKLEIPEKEIQGLKKGNLAQVETPSGIRYTGKVTRISQQVSPETLSFACVVEVDNPNRELLSGATVLVKVEGQSLPQALSVPADAVFEDQQGAYVMVEKEGFARKTPVHLVYTQGKKSILSEGPEDGSHLIIEGAHLVSDGEPVRVITEG